MQETSISIITTPTVDIQHYLEIILNFIIGYFPNLIIFLKSVIGILIGLSIPISIILFIGIIIAVEGLKSIRKKEEKILNHTNVDMGYEVKAKGHHEMSKKWERVLGLVESINPNDWRQAILEADVLLGDVLTHLGYKGEGIGEQLRRANKSDFKTLQDAGEAHGIRNKIAHSGSDFNFTQIEARKVIHQYRKVFEEFFYI